MKEFLENNTSLDFIYLKQFLTDYFKDNPFEFRCDNIQDIIAQNKFNKSVSMLNNDLEENLRFEDSCYPEYLFLISNNKRSTILQQRLTDVSKQLNFISFNPYLFSYKMRQLFEIILFKDFYKKDWISTWLMNRCYVIKINDNLEYYTVYDYPKLVNNLLEWLSISCELTHTNELKTYKIRIEFNV